MKDSFARWIGVLSLVIAIAGVYFTRASGPYFQAHPSRMCYWYKKWNRLTKDEKPESGHLEVLVYNGADTPARDVLVVVRPMRKDPKITCSGPYEIQEGPDGTMLVNVKRIASKDTVTVSVDEYMDEYPQSRSIFSEDVLLYYPTVLECQTEFGEIKLYFRNVGIETNRVGQDKVNHEKSRASGSFWG